MSVTLKKDSWKIKDPNTGDYRDSAIFSTVLPEEAAAVVQDCEDQIGIIAEAVASMAEFGTDKTLTIEGAAADAEVVGDKIGVLEQKCNFVIPEMFGAKGDGTTDDTQAIQDAINYGSQHGVPVHIDGQYKVDEEHVWTYGGGTKYHAITVPSNSYIVFGENAVLNCIGSEVKSPNVLQIDSVDNVKIIGGELICSRGKVTFSDTQIEGGINITRSSNVVIDGMKIHAVNGSGIKIIPVDYTHLEHIHKDIMIKNCVIYDCNHLGIAHVGGENVEVDNCSIYDIGNGQDIVGPNSGIDLESDYEIYPCKNFKLTNTKIYNCNNASLLFSGVPEKHVTKGDIIVDNCYFDSKMVVNVNDDTLTVNNTKFLDSIYIGDSIAGTISINNSLIQNIISAKSGNLFFDQCEIININSEMNYFIVLDTDNLNETIFNKCVIRNGDNIGGVVTAAGANRSVTFKDCVFYYDFSSSTTSNMFYVSCNKFEMVGNKFKGKETSLSDPISGCIIRAGNSTSEDFEACLIKDNIFDIYGAFTTGFFRGYCKKAIIEGNYIGVKASTNVVRCRYNTSADVIFANNIVPYVSRSNLVNTTEGETVLSINNICASGGDNNIPAPSSPQNGQYLVYNSSAWTAQSLPVYNGGVT